MIARAALAALLLAAAPAHAYAWMVSHGYATCATCHLDPSGAGVLTPYGRAQGEVLLESRFGKAAAEEASPRANFLWNALQTPEWLLGGGELRGMALASRLGAASTSVAAFPMQVDASAGVVSGGFRAAVTAGVVGSNGSLASVFGNVIAREYWAGYSWNDGAWLVRAGRINLPFGIRTLEHTLYVRQSTRTDLNDTQDHGVALAYTGEHLRGEVMGIAGNYQVGPDAHRERGYSGYLEWLPTTHLALGLSSLVAHSQDDVYLRLPLLREGHGVFARAAIADKLVVLCEADFLVQAPSGLSVQRGLSTMLQADVEPWQGVHFIATGESFDAGGTGVSYGGWLSAAWFFGLHMDLRFDVNDKSDVIGNQRIQTVATMLQFHAYL